MSVDREDVRRIAELARLRLSEAEAEALGRDLSEILEYVDTLSSVSVDDAGAVDPTEGGAPERGPGERNPDPMAEPPTHYAPDFRDGFFVVPSPPSLGGEGEPSGRA